MVQICSGLKVFFSGCKKSLFVWCKLAQKTCRHDFNSYFFQWNLYCVMQEIWFLPCTDGTIQHSSIFPYRHTHAAQSNLEKFNSNRSGHPTGLRNSSFELIFNLQYQYKIREKLSKHCFPWTVVALINLMSLENYSANS